MSQCKKFAPNIFHKTKCSNCFRQKEEHSAEALECNRASRSIARSGYLFVAPDWDFSVPLNRTKRWQRRWFVLYDDGELNYSVDEHPDTVPQGSVDMSQVLEVTGAEQVTGHPHSLALTGPDRVTFVKAASREDARWWAELLAVFPRRHKRNATFPGGRASPSLPQLGRSASPQPPRPRHLSCTGPSPRTNFTTPPLKEERESPVKEDAHRPTWVPKPTSNLTIDTTPARTDYVVTSGSPPTRDKLRCEDKTRTGRDWRNERLRDIATALTDRSPESSLPFPAEGVLNLKKGWLWYKDNTGEWLRRWWVLCGSTLKGYRDQDEQGIPEVVIELATITAYCEVTTEIRYGFQVQCAGQILILSAVTSGIRSNWLQALKKAAPMLDSSPPTPVTPRSSLLSSDEEYRTASEGGRRDSEDWGELPPSPPLTRNMLAKVKEKTRLKSKLPRNQSRQSTVDSVSTDELEAYKEPDAVELKNTINRQTVEMEGLRQQYSNALNDIQALEAELTRFKKLQSESLQREKQTKELLQSSERITKDLTLKLKEVDDKHLREQTTLQSRLLETERAAKEYEEKYFSVSRELQAKQKAMANMQEELNCVNEKHTKSRHENDRLYRRVQEMECKPSSRRKHLDSLTDLTDIDLDADLENLAQSELIEQCLDLRSRFEKAVVEIRAVKRELRESHIKFDQLELENLGLRKSLELAEQESQTQCALMAERVQDLTTKLAAVEKQARNLKSKLQDSREKRRSLSLKGRESCSINKEVEDKVTELEAKILNLERNRSRRKHKRERSSERASPIDDRSLRRLRRKSLDSVTASEPMKLLVRLSNLENKLTNITTSNESLNTSSANATNQTPKTEEADVKGLCAESIILAAKEKLNECRCTFNLLKNNRSRTGAEAQDKLEASLSDLSNILSLSISENEVRVIEMSAGVVVKHLENLLRDKLLSLREKARALKESNQWNNRAKLELLAEKLAFENIIITRIKEALYSPVLNERLLNKEAVETASLLSNIQGKLNGVVLMKQVPQFKTSVEYLTKVLAKRLVMVAHGFSNSNLDGRHIGNNFCPVLKYLENERDKVSMLLCTYKSNKLPQLAESLACETLSLADDQTCHLNSLDKDTVNDIWKVARETVNIELIQSEISHVLVRTAQSYEDGASADQNYFFSFFACERAALELWSDAVEVQLQVEVERNIDELTEAYKASLSKLQRSRRVDTERKGPLASVLLNEFADILAHKALIDARISVLKSEYANTGRSNQPNFLGNSENDDVDPLLVSLGDLGITRVSPSVEAEFKCLFTHYSGECERLLDQTDLDDIRNTLQELSGEICELIGSSSDEQVRIASVRDVYYKCLELKRRVMEVKSVFLEMKNSKRYDNEEDRRPLYLGTEYLNQVENLRAAYRCTLADCENRKQQADLEQLQVLCERVLVAMEHWHRRTLQDLREQHSRELQALRQDKEQALAEETQATLAALDAMRKAHEAEVQREVAKFKQDFARQQQDELLELTERLSVKCLEAAALEEQLGSATRQLAHAQRHILQLERNPQFSLQN